MAKKKITPVKKKDAKKVAAGKARAAKSLRVNGRFTTNEFLEDITEKAQKSGYKNPFDYFRQNEKQLTKLYTSWMLGVQIFDYKFMQTIREYAGEIIVNNRQNTSGTALKKVMHLNQILRIEHNVKAWWITPYVKLDGGLKFNFPTEEEADSLSEMDTEQMEDYLQQYNIGVIISDTSAVKTKIRYNSKKGKYVVKKINPNAKK